jgi:hypothetical protein
MKIALVAALLATAGCVTPLEETAPDGAAEVDGALVTDRAAESEDMRSAPDPNDPLMTDLDAPEAEQYRVTDPELIEILDRLAAEQAPSVPE